MPLVSLLSETALLRWVWSQMYLLLANPVTPPKVGWPVIVDVR